MSTDILIQKDDPYSIFMATWLQGKPDSTRRSYTTALRDFLAFVDKHPRDITPLDVAQWKEFLKRELADSTVAQRLSAVSSYYLYLVKNQVQVHNPVSAIERRDLEINPYERSRKLTLDDFQSILNQVDSTTEIGARDKAIFLFYVLCARRRSEVVNLRGRDLRVTGDNITYRVRLKRGKVTWKEMPPPIWKAINHYLNISGRLLTNETPVFVATVNTGNVLRDYYGVSVPPDEQPLTGEAVNQALRRYASQAGLDPEAITLHSLRHLGAELYHDASKDLSETQVFLDHKRLDTTQIYMKQLKGDEHKHWEEMASRLELD